MTMSQPGVYTYADVIFDRGIPHPHDISMLYGHYKRKQMGRKQ